MTTRVVSALSVAVATVLVCVGSWSQAAARGYEHGKADAAHALRSYGAVVVYPDGRCAVYDQPGQTVTLAVNPMTAHVTMLVRVMR